MELKFKRGTIFTPILKGVGRSIFNVYFIKEGVRKYYGGLKALFDDNEDKDLGVSKHTLYKKKDVDWEKEYSNGIISITKGELISTGDVKKKPPTKKPTNKKK